MRLSPGQYQLPKYVHYVPCRPVISTSGRVQMTGGYEVTSIVALDAERTIDRRGVVQIEGDLGRRGDAELGEPIEQRAAMPEPPHLERAGRALLGHALGKPTGYRSVMRQPGDDT